jgi:hypothetical protein
MPNATLAWQTGPSLPTPRESSGAAVIAGDLFVAGGWSGSGALADVLVASPGAMAFTAMPALPSPREHLALASVGERRSAGKFSWASGSLYDEGMGPKPPFLVFSGATCGLVGGLAMGAMTSHAIGVVLCMLFGGAVGAIAGLVMHREELRAKARTRQLDDIIGITKGSMGTPSGSIPPGALDDESRELQSWAREWLTPPPPAVG